MKYLIILILLTNCTSNYPELSNVYFKAGNLDHWMSQCERSYNKACQLHGKEAVYE